MHLNNLASVKMKTATIASLHLRKSINRSPLRLAFLLIPVVLVWFARFDHAQAQSSNQEYLRNSWDVIRSQTAETGRARAQMGLSPSLGPSYAPQSYQQILQRMKAKAQASDYHPPLAMLQFPITATDFTPTAARLLPTKYARAIPGLTPKERAGAVAQYHRFLDTFERLGRKNNVASSCAYLVGVSMEVVKRQPVSNSDFQLLTSAFNYDLANNLRFVTMAPRDKQFLYESNIITAGWIAYWAIYGSEQQQQRARVDAWAVLK
jgi:hypothetical protein